MVVLGDELIECRLTVERGAGNRKHFVAFISRKFWKHVTSVGDLPAVQRCLRHIRHNARSSLAARACLGRGRKVREEIRCCYLLRKLFLVLCAWGKSAKTVLL